MPFLLLRPDEFRSRDKVVTYRDHGRSSSRRVENQLRRLIASADVTSNDAMVAYDNRHSHNDYQVSVSQSYNRRPVSYSYAQNPVNYSSYAYPVAYPAHNGYAAQPYNYRQYPMVSSDYYPQCPTCCKQFLRVSKRDDHMYRHCH